jgi:hypothetical protein
MAAHRPQYHATKSATTGALTANDASSAVVTAGAVTSWHVNEKRGLSANVAVGFYTLNLAVRGKWQGSTDNSTWVDYVPENAAANVTLQSSTGTRTVAVMAPPAVLSKAYCRYGLYIVGSATGTASDTYTLSYSYAENKSFTPE